MLIDTHSHLFWDSFEPNLDQVIQRAIESGVKTVINVGTDLETSKKALEQVEQAFNKTPDFTAYCSIGIHPHEAHKYFLNPDESIHQDIVKLEAIYRQNPKKVIAVGECGLDYLFESNPDYIPSSLTSEQLKDLQKKLLKAQVNLAKKLNLPLLIHTREAWDEIFDLVTDYYGLFHCYSGDEATTQKVLQTNFLISFAATITYPKNESLRQIAKNLSLDRFVLETDSPFLPPQSKRGFRNEPFTIQEIAGLIAQLKGISSGEVALATTYNTRKLFRLT